MASSKIHGSGSNNRVLTCRGRRWHPACSTHRCRQALGTHGQPPCSLCSPALCQGGPGCASLFGAFYELGPELVDDRLGLVPNPGKALAAVVSTHMCGKHPALYSSFAASTCPHARMGCLRSIVWASGQPTLTPASTLVTNAPTPDCLLRLPSRSVGAEFPIHSYDSTCRRLESQVGAAVHRPTSGGGLQHAG